MKLHRFLILPILLLIAACGSDGGAVYSSSSGGGASSSSSSSSASSSSSSSASPTGPSASGANVADIVIDNGPTGGGGSANVPFVTVTLCLPGTSTCQVIDHVILDTGSVGLRIQKEALNASLTSALPHVAGSSVHTGECYQYADGYVFGSVRRSDITIGGKTVANMPLMIIGDDGDFANVPDNCSGTGGTQMHSVADFGAKGIIGIGTTVYDCGTSCASRAGYYYACTPSGCIAKPLETANQVPNPVAMMTGDSNGTIIDLPTVGSSGARSLAGKLYFGIGTQSNNGLQGRTPLTLTETGELTAVYNGRNLVDSFVDSGSNLYAFNDHAITLCPDSDLTGFYCPPSALTLSSTLTGRNGRSQTVSLQLYNARMLADSGNSVLPGLGGDPNAFDNISIGNSFDFGLPFFLGRRIYTAISGRMAEGTAGPYVAF